jgi:L-ascorbate metabolism protein UlaG (beta-lactamase superfamily)
MVAGSPSYEPYRALELPPTKASPGQLRLRYFGTSTLLVSDGATSLLIDGFFSRPSFSRLVFGTLAPNEERIRAALNAGGVAMKSGDGLAPEVEGRTKLDAILVAHSHHDHALDSAAVAQLTGATVFGSESTRIIGRAQGFPGVHYEVVDYGHTEEIGATKINVTFLRSVHSPTPLPEGGVSEAFRSPAHLFRFKPDKLYAYQLQHSSTGILVVPSGSFEPGAFANVRPYVVLLGIGSLGKHDCASLKRYWDAAVRETKAKLVIPIHWDHFGKGLEEGLRPLPRILDRFDKTIPRLLKLANRDHVAIRFLPLYEEVALTADVPDLHQQEELRRSLPEADCEFGAPAPTPDAASAQAK